MNEKVILLVEDNPTEELLTLRALQKNNITDKVVVARDGEQAIDYVVGTRSSSGRGSDPLPQLILLDLKLPKESARRCERYGPSIFPCGYPP